MTRRERLEAKIEKRREWAEKRTSKGNALLARGDKFRGDVAFNTQPGHIPERARIISATDRGFENLAVAKHHEQKAAGLEDQLDRTIFSDDDNAVEALEARIREHEAARAHHTAVNKAFRKSKAETKAGKLAEILAAGVIDRAEAMRIAHDLGLCHWQKQPYPAYVNANLGNRISADRKRIEDVKERVKRAAEATEAGGVKIERHEEVNWCVVTFAEKPSREILDALRAAAYRWSGGSWCGYLNALPDCVQ